MPSLVRLKLTNSRGFGQLTSDAGGRVITGMRAVVCAPWFGRLRSLSIDCAEPPTFNDLAGCGAPCLTHLEFRCDHFSDAAAAALGQLALPSLRVLDLSVNSGVRPAVALTACGVAALLAAEGLAGGLQELHLMQHKTSLANGDASLAAIACAPLASLRTLSISECGHTDTTLASVALACWAPQLTCLVLDSVDGRFHRKGAAWQALAAAPLGPLREFYMQCKPVMSAGVAAHLMSAPWLGGLHTLYLSGISRGALEVLEASPVFASLQASQHVRVLQVEAEQAAVALVVGPEW
jgi:hypothetical protein